MFVDLQNLLLIDKGERKMLNAIQEGSSLGDVNHQNSRPEQASQELFGGLTRSPGSLQSQELVRIWVSFHGPNSL